METVDVIIASYGDNDVWKSFRERALDSYFAQTIRQEGIGCWVGHTDETNLADARNHFASQSKADYLIFLDADDELDLFFIHHMMKGTGDIRQPSTLGIVNGVEDDFPVLIPQKSLIVGNYLIIGSMVRRDLFEAVGGFRDFPILEDWDFWIRCKLAGAEIRAVPEAIYRVHVNEGSRNKQPPHVHGQTYSAIQKEHEGEYIRKFGRT